MVVLAVYVRRESTRLSCVVAFVPQTSLDPQQMKSWIPNNDYGHHAFALPSMAEFISKRESLMPWIAQFSPYALATTDDPVHHWAPFFHRQAGSRAPLAHALHVLPGSGCALTLSWFPREPLPGSG